MNFIKTDDTQTINQYRADLYEGFTAPIDGMWESLYIASAQDYLVEHNGKTIGYCCIDTNNCLLQLFLTERNKHLMKTTVEELINTKLINSASLSSIEPISFNACLLLSTEANPNTFCYQYSTEPVSNAVPLNIVHVQMEDLDAVKAFFKNQIGFDDTFGYTENLVNRKELYMLKKADTIIATGERRISDSQPTIADVGVIVNKDHQKKGLGTQVLQTLAEKAKKENKKPICSTTNDNIASKKAIERAGFYNSHIVFDMSF